MPSEEPRARLTIRAGVSEQPSSAAAHRAKQHSPGAKRTGGSGMRSLLLLAQSGTVDAAAAVRSPGDIGAVRNILASLVTGSL